MRWKLWLLACIKFRERFELKIESAKRWEAGKAFNVALATDTVSGLVQAGVRGTAASWSGESQLVVNHYTDQPLATLSQSVCVCVVNCIMYNIHQSPVLADSWTAGIASTSLHCMFISSQKGFQSTCVSQE